MIIWQNPVIDRDKIPKAIIYADLELWDNPFIFIHFQNNIVIVIFYEPTTNLKGLNLISQFKETFINISFLWFIFFMTEYFSSLSPCFGFFVV